MSDHIEDLRRSEVAGMLSMCALVLHQTSYFLRKINEPLAEEIQLSAERASAIISEITSGILECDGKSDTPTVADNATVQSFP